MNTLSQFKKGDLLFRQGDASDHVLRVRSGEIEVLREIGIASVLLGHVRGGECSLTAHNDVLRARIGATSINVSKLPFVAGRIPVEGEVKPALRPDLMIEDEEPFRLSRQHFMIARSGDRLVVSDLGSALGTIVNGQPIGHHFMRDAAPQHRGENLVFAGGSIHPSNSWCPSVSRCFQFVPLQCSPLPGSLQQTSVIAIFPGRGVL
jgi:FHA domain